MTASAQLEPQDPRISAMDQAAELADLLCGDLVLAPFKDGKPDWPNITRDTLEKIQPYAGGIGVGDILRLGVLTDSFDRFCSHPAAAGASVLTALRGGTPEIRQIGGAPCVAALDIIMDAIFNRTAISEMPFADKPRPNWLPSVLSAPANDNPAPTGVKPIPPLMALRPMDYENAGGLLGKVAEWINRTAIIPVPELAMVSAAALLAGLFGDRLLTPLHGGINLFATTILATGGGKAHAPKAIRALADRAGKPGAVTNGDPTSYAAIERMLRKNISTVAVLDEFGLTLQAVNGRNATAPAASIRKFLLAIYDQANGKFDGRIYASSETKKTDDPLDGPALTVLAMTTEATLYAGLGEAAIGDGFLNRFVFVRGSGPQNIAAPSLTRDVKPPRELVDALQDAVKASPLQRDGLKLTKPAVPFADGEEGYAYKLWAKIFMWQHSSEWDDTERAINGRAAENTLRLATIRAISRNPAAPAVSVDDVEWGWAIVHASIATVMAGVEAHMSSSPAEALRKAIIAALTAAPQHTLPLSKLMERSGVRGADHRSLGDALLWLTQAGRIMDLAGRPAPGRGSKFVLLNP